MKTKTYPNLFSSAAAFVRQNGGEVKTTEIVVCNTANCNHASHSPVQTEDTVTAPEWIHSKLFVHWNKWNSERWTNTKPLEDWERE